MGKSMLINAVDPEECRIAVMDDGSLQEFYVERTAAANVVGNIYKGRVTNIEPSIQAAFVDYGTVKNGFLHVSDMVSSYFPENVRSRGPQKPPIQTILKRGQEVIVQVTKDGIGTKGATLSTYLSIAGRYLVLMPGLQRVGVSRKIEDDAERRKLREALEGLDRPKNLGIIIRTAGVNQPKPELRRDLTYLTRVWKLVSEKIASSKCPGAIYRESDLAVRTVRDLFTSDVERIYIDDAEAAKRVCDFLSAAMPRYVNRVEVYEGKVPLFHKYGIEEELAKIYSRTVPLPSGGYLVVEQTEALVSIDVNSHKFRAVSNPEESAYRLNLEAAKEIVRQLRLRDLGGVIVMDFVDMRSEKHRRGVEEVLRTELKKDRARSKFLKTSRFGLIEMTRQRMRPSLERSSFMDCPHCSGSGLIKTPESMSLDVMRQLTLAASQDDIAQIEVTVHPIVGHYINNRKRRTLVALEEKSGKQIMVISDPTVSQETARFHCQDNRAIPIKFDPHEAARQQERSGDRPKQDRGRSRGRPQAAAESAPVTEKSAREEVFEEIEETAEISGGEDSFDEARKIAETSDHEEQFAEAREAHEMMVAEDEPGPAPKPEPAAAAEPAEVPGRTKGAKKAKRKAKAKKHHGKKKGAAKPEEPAAAASGAPAPSPVTPSEPRPQRKPRPEPRPQPQSSSAAEPLAIPAAPAPARADKGAATGPTSGQNAGPGKMSASKKRRLRRLRAAVKKKAEASAQGGSAAPEMPSGPGEGPPQ